MWTFSAVDNFFCPRQKLFAIGSSFNVLDKIDFVFNRGPWAIKVMNNEVNEVLKSKMTLNAQLSGS